MKAFEPIDSRFHATIGDGEPISALSLVLPWLDTKTEYAGAKRAIRVTDTVAGCAFPAKQESTCHPERHTCYVYLESPFRPVNFRTQWQEGSVLRLSLTRDCNSPETKRVELETWLLPEDWRPHLEFTFSAESQANERDVHRQMFSMQLFYALLADACAQSGYGVIAHAA